MGDPVHIEGPLWRAASGRLWLHLEDDPIASRVDELDVVRRLEATVGARFDRPAMVVEVLQEDWILPFRARGGPLSLDRDFWSGLTVLALSPGADEVVLDVRRILKDSPPRGRDADDGSAVVSKAFLEWLRLELGAADLTCWR